MTLETELPDARNKLHDAISALIDPRPQQANGRTCWLNPRYHELREALTSQHGGTRSPPKSRPPAWLEAIDTLVKIDRTVRKLEPDLPITQCDDYPTVQRLRIYSQRKWRPQDVEAIKSVTNGLQTYVADIDKLFAQNPKYLPDNCPRCGHAKATRQLDGETVRVPALQITDIGATCNYCKAHWPPDMLKFLGRQLGYHIQGVIE